MRILDTRWRDKKILVPKNSVYGRLESNGLQIIREMFDLDARRRDARLQRSSGQQHHGRPFLLSDPLSLHYPLYGLALPSFLALLLTRSSSQPALPPSRHSPLFILASVVPWCAIFFRSVEILINSYYAGGFFLFSGIFISSDNASTFVEWPKSFRMAVIISDYVASGKPRWRYEEINRTWPIQNRENPREASRFPLTNWEFISTTRRGDSLSSSHDEMVRSTDTEIGIRNNFLNARCRFLSLEKRDGRLKLIDRRVPLRSLYDKFIFIARPSSRSFSRFRRLPRFPRWGESINSNS